MRKVLGCVIVGLLLLASVFPVLAHGDLSGGKTHVVQPGDTLFSIARWYGVDLWTLARYNGIVNPSYIYVGQQLRIPTGGTTAPSAGVYVVQPGDTLYSVARLYGTSAWAIAQANGLYNINHIYVGQRLVIPGATSSPPAPKPTATPAPAKPAPPSSATTGWQGAYYAGMELSGAPKFVRTDRAVNFHWGDKSPDTRLNTDEFSVRWTRVINFRGGVYRFSMTADDGARIWVDGELVLDAWEIEPGTTHEVDVTLTPGEHSVVIDYFEQAGIATAQFTFKRLGDAPPPATPTPAPIGDGTATPEPTSEPTGEASTVAWWGEYYANRDLTGEPAATRWDPHLGFEWEQASPMPDLSPDGFSVRWTREVYFYDDNYEICARADDGVRLYLDGELIIDEWHGSPASENYCVEINLRERYHTVVVEYYEHEVDALIYVWWDRR